ncbi:MAG: hypothetical protein ABSB50_20385 [Terracidiphilus sp.]
MTSENLNMRKHMYFIGVSTRQSSIMKVFPLWMKELGMPYLSLEGMDLKLNDDPANYRRAVTQIKEELNLQKRSPASPSGAAAWKGTQKIP